MLAKVDSSDGLADRAHQSLDEPVPASCDRDDGAVVVGVRVGVEQVGGAGGGRDRLHHVVTAPFGKVRHRFEERFCLHANR